MYFYVHKFSLIELSLCRLFSLSWLSPFLKKASCCCCTQVRPTYSRPCTGPADLDLSRKESRPGDPGREKSSRPAKVPVPARRSGKSQVAHWPISSGLRPIGRSRHKYFSLISPRIFCIIFDPIAAKKM